MRALVITTLAGAMALSGCTDMGTLDKTAIGGLVGAAAGYGLSRSNANSSAQNNRAAAIGAVLGAAGGYYLDQKEKKLKAQLAGSGVDVNRNPDGSIGLVMPGNITFDTNSYNIKPSFYGTLNKVATTLTEDNKVAVVVSGYTDSTGNDSINIPLSNNRANSVAQYLVSQGIPRNRINSQGYGAQNPIASNSTASGREQNRRVEINIYATQAN